MINRRSRVFVLAIFGLVSSLFCVRLCQQSAFAAPTVNIQKRITDKAIYQGVYKCYTSNAIKSSVELANYVGMDSLMGGNADSVEINLVSGGHEGAMSRMINSNNIRYNVGSDSLTCRQFFIGGSSGFNGNNQGLLQATGHEAPDSGSSDAVVEFFENMGYVVPQGESGGTCFRSTFSVSTGRGTQTMIQTRNKLCMRNGELSSQPPGTDVSLTGIDAAFDVQDGQVCLKFMTADSGLRTKCNGLVGGAVLTRSTLVDTIKEICDDSDSVEGVCTFGGETGPSMSYKFSDLESANAEEGNLDGIVASFPGAGRRNSEAANHAIQFLSNNQMGEDLELSRAEKRILYQEYLTDYYGYEIDCANEHVNASIIWWYDGASGEVKECSITATGSNGDEMVHAVDGSGMFEGTIDAAGIIAYLNTERDYTDEELAEMGDVLSGAQEYEDVSDCRGMGAGRSLGWILCPILELMGDGAEGIYENMVAPMLEIKSYLFNGQDTATYSAWSTFRDIANVMFVIVLLVVIFSQVTGIGIDNYGIKRILPKLIVCIVLINMSYLICAILIDLSNILGNGLKLMFDNLGNELNVGNIMITQPAEAYPAGSSAGSGFASAAGSGLVGVTLLVGFATMVGAIWSVTIGPMVLISLLFAGLGVLISIVFTFFLLGARQSAIVVLVTVSPVIVLLSALPNTKSLYNRFVKMFQILLFVYPIMGLLVGGGNYVSKLLLLAAPGEFYMALTAMVVGIVPIFFLPSLLREAMAALPKVGQMLSGLGDKARGLSTKAQGTLLKSEGVKNLERESQLSHARGVVNKLKDRSNLSNAQKMRLLSAASMMKKLENENKVANIFAAKERYRDNKVGLERDARSALLKGDTENAEALLGAMTELHGAKSTAGFVSQFYANEGKNLDTKGLQDGIRAVKEHVTSNPGIMKELKEDNKDILSMVVSGGINKEGEPDGLSYFTREEAKKNKMEHWVTQSNESLQRAAASGVLNSEKAQSILDANNEKSSVFYNKLSDENRKYLGKIAGSGSGAGSSGAGGAASGASGPVEPVGTIESNYGGSSLNGSQSDEWRRQYAAEEQMQNTIDNARRNGGFGSSSNPRRNPPGNPPR